MKQLISSVPRFVLLVSEERIMLRIFSDAFRAAAERVIAPNITNSLNNKSNLLLNLISPRILSINHSQVHNSMNLNSYKNGTLLSGQLANNILSVKNELFTTPVRSVTKFSMRKGKRGSVKPVLDRFLRLHWGIWIHTKCGRHSRLWRKSINRKKRLRRHVFCNATQSWLLDKMVGKFWKRPKFYVDDPYEPYHRRDNFEKTRKIPLP